MQKLLQSMDDRFVTKLKADRGAAAICRLCATLRKLDCFVHIHDTNLNLVMKLERCCRLVLNDHDNLPKNVCLECIQSLDKCWSFAEKVREAQESLQALFATDVIKVEQAQSEIYQKPKASIRSLDPRPTTTKPLQQDPILRQTSQASDANSEECTLILGDDEDESAVNDEAFSENDNNDDEIEVFIESNQNYEGDAEIIDLWRDYPWICTVCLIVLPGVLELREHARNEHDTLDYTYVCADCSKSYTKYYLFYNHIISHRQHFKMYCDLCSEFFKPPDALAKHREEHNCDDCVALCPICAKAFKNALSLHSHLRIHKEQGSFACDDCGKNFGSKPNLNAHRKIHFGIKEFVCDQCGKSFAQKANLEEHLVSHMTEKPYTCNECDKSFKTPARLARHKKVHSLVRPYKCEQCGKQFREKDTLRIHMRIHTGVRPYECEFCGKRFRFRSILVTHRHQHTGVRPYSCQECDHHFTNWPNYNKHMKRRHGKTAGRVRPRRKSPDSYSASTSEAIISIHSYSAPQLDTSTLELEKFLDVHHVRDENETRSGTMKKNVDNSRSEARKVVTYQRKDRK